MYTTIVKILESGLSRDEFIQLLNDEMSEPNLIILDPEDENYDPNNPIIKRAEGKIRKADTLIDAFLRGLFTLPLTTTPQMIEDLSTDISIHFIHEHRHRKAMPEDLIIKFKDNMKLLNQIQRGEVKPGIDETTERADIIIRTDKTSTDKTFTDDYMADF